MFDTDAPALRIMPREKAWNILCRDAHVVPDTGPRVRQKDHLEARSEMHLLGPDLKWIFDWTWSDKIGRIDYQSWKSHGIKR